MTEPGPDPDPGPPRAARALVLAAFAVLLIAGLGDIEAWPLTSWRLFSLSRDETQTMWVLEAVDEEGRSRTVSLEDLPLRYRHAAWPMADLPDAPTAEREELCQALLDPAHDVVPDLTELWIVRDEQKLVQGDGDWTVSHDPEVIHRCARGGPG